MLKDILFEILNDDYIRGLLVTLIAGLIVSGIAWVLRFLGMGIPVWLTTTVDLILNKAIPRIVAGLEQKHKIAPLKDPRSADIVKASDAVDYGLNQRLERRAIDLARKEVPVALRAAVKLAVPATLSDESLSLRVNQTIKQVNDAKKIGAAVSGALNGS